MARWDNLLAEAQKWQQTLLNTNQQTTQQATQPQQDTQQKSNGTYKHHIVNPQHKDAVNKVQAPTTQKKSTYTVNAGNQPYVDQLNSLYDQIMNRKPFQYDLNGDLLYRQMADQYTQLGQQAMRDATGTAAGLTGGYGNSYANQVGNQAYQQYLTALNQNIPELYDRAYQAYLNQGDQLMQQYQLAAAHPGYLDAIKPRTYTVSDKKDDPATNDDQLAYQAALQNAGLLGIMTGAMQTVPTNQLEGWTYKLLEEQKKK